MADTIRLNKVLRELNISIDRAVEFLDSKGIEIQKRPTTKISVEIYEILSDEFQTDASKKVASKEVSEAKQKEKEALRIEREREIEGSSQEIVSPEKTEVSAVLPPRANTREPLSSPLLSSLEVCTSMRRPTV